MRGVALAIIAITLVARDRGTSTPATPAPAASPLPTPTPEYGYVSARERLFARSTPDAPSIALDRRRVHQPGWHYPVAVAILARHGEYAEVETLLPELSASFCGAAHDLLAVSVRGFVKQSALLPVTTKPQAFDFGDGTRLTVARGVAVHPAAGHVEVKGMKLAAAIAKTDIGDAFAEPGPFRRHKLDYFLRRGASAKYGTNVLPQEAFGDSEALLPFALLADEVAADPDPARGYLATLGLHCASVRVRVGADDLVDWARPTKTLGGTTVVNDMSRPPTIWGYPTLAPGRTIPDMLGGGEYDPGGDVVARHRITPGKPISWPDGTPAGTVGDRSLLFHWEPITRDGASCFAMYDGASDGGELCFRPSDVEREPIDRGAP